MKTLEQELKLILTADEYRKLMNLTDQFPVLQVNYYFVGNFPIEEKTVRIREKNGRYILCCKSRIADKNGVFVCDERECELEKSFAENLLKRGITAKEINNILQTDFLQNLQYIGKMDTYRTTFMLEKWRMELDKNFYLDFCDFELECESESAASLDSLKEYLQSVFSLEIRFSVPKSARFFNALNH